MCGFDPRVIAKLCSGVDAWTDGLIELSCNSFARCCRPVKVIGNMCMGKEQKLLCMTFFLKYNYELEWFKRTPFSFLEINFRTKFYFISTRFLHTTSTGKFYDQPRWATTMDTPPMLAKATLQTLCLPNPSMTPLTVPSPPLNKPNAVWIQPLLNKI